jgi:hypothetical protein
MCYWAIEVKDETFLSTKYSACSELWSLVRKGITLSVLWCVEGVLGMLRATQKSSDNRPV